MIPRKLQDNIYLFHKKGLRQCEKLQDLGDCGCDYCDCCSRGKTKSNPTL